MLVSPGFADELAIPTEETFFSEVPVVLSATRLQQAPSDAPAAITVIDREMIEASGATEIADLFRLVPGFQVGHVNDELLVIDPVAVTYHGLADQYARRLQVLIDGRSIYSPDFGGVRWNKLPIVLDDIERIEVIRGPNAATYGANSFLAVINIVTRHPDDVSRHFAKSTFGGNHLFEGIYRYGAQDEKYSYRMTVGHRADSGFDGQNDDKSLSLVTYRGVYRPSGEDTIDINLGYSSGANAAGEALSPAENPFHDTSVRTHYQQVKWTRNISATEQCQLQFYRNFYDSTDHYTGTYPNPAPPPVTIPGDVNKDMTTERLDIEFQYISQWRDDMRIVWGGEARRDTALGVAWFNSSEPMTNYLYRAFTNMEWKPSSTWTVNTGAMLEHTDLSGASLSPRLAVNYHASPNQTWRAGVSRALRTPSLYEALADSYIYYPTVPMTYQTIVSASGIRPEKLTSYEIGYLAKSSDRKFAIDFKLFDDRFEDMIGYPNTSLPTDPWTVFMNAGDIRIYGAELGLEYRPDANKRLIYSHSYAVQEGNLVNVINWPSLTPISTLDTANNTPLNTISVLGIARLKRNLTLSAGFYHTDDFFHFGGVDIGDLNKLDIRLARRFKFSHHQAQIEVVGQNLWGSYYDYRDDAPIDRRVFIKLTISAR